jgi:hypothetical protein
MIADCPLSLVGALRDSKVLLLLAKALAKDPSQARTYPACYLPAPAQPPYSSSSTLLAN